MQLSTSTLLSPLLLVSFLLILLNFMPVVPLFSIRLRCRPPTWDQTTTFLSHFVVFLLWLYKRRCGVSRDWFRVILATGPPLSASARTCQISSLSPAHSGALLTQVSSPSASSKA